MVNRFKVAFFPIGQASGEPKKVKMIKKVKPKYSHLFNKRGAWNKRGGGAKVAKLLNVEAGINVEAGHFLKIIKRGGGKTYLINVEGGT